MTSYPSIKNGEDGMVYTLEHKEGKDEWISTKTKIDDWAKGKNYYPTSLEWSKKFRVNITERDVTIYSEPEKREISFLSSLFKKKEKDKKIIFSKFITRFNSVLQVFASDDDLYDIYNGSTILVHLKEKEYILITGDKILQFSLKNDKILDLKSPYDGKHVIPFGIGQNYLYDIENFNMSVKERDVIPYWKKSTLKKIGFYEKDNKIEDWTYNMIVFKNRFKNKNIPPPDGLIKTKNFN